MQAEEILIGYFVECQSIKKVGGRRSVEELYQALFFVSPVAPECFTERNEIEPDRRLYLSTIWISDSVIYSQYLQFLLDSVAVQVA